MMTLSISLMIRAASQADPGRARRKALPGKWVQVQDVYPL